MNTFILIPLRVNLNDQKQISGSLGQRKKCGFFATDHKEIWGVTEVQLTLE